MIKNSFEHCFFNGEPFGNYCIFYLKSCKKATPQNERKCLHYRSTQLHTVQEIKAMRKYTRMTWEQWYQLAKEYYQINHDLRVPGRYRTSQGIELGRWIERQRTAYHGSGKYTIDKHQIYALEQIGMEWELRRRTDWDVWYGMAKEFSEQYGHLRVPAGYVVDSFPLGEWIKQQRKFYRSGKLGQERVQRLEKIGMEWYLRKSHGKTEETIR